MESNHIRPNIGVLAESFPGERRVALIPADVARLGKLATVTIERGAGKNSGYLDESYIEAGAIIADRSTTIACAQIVIGVRAPSDLSGFRATSVVISLGGRDEAVSNVVDVLRLRHLAFERLPRTTRAQTMDVLSSQATIAGYAAVIEGARTLDVLLPMLTTAAGDIKPAKVIALGAGVAGLQAIATARRLGAVVHGFDVRDSA